MAADGAEAAALTSTLPSTCAGEWREALEAFARAADVTDAPASSWGHDNPPPPPSEDSITFNQGLIAEERAAVHKEARRLGLASRSVGSDHDGSRAVTVSRRPAGATNTGSVKRNGNNNNTAPNTTTAAAAAAAADRDVAAVAWDADDATSAWEVDTHVDLRGAPFDVHRVLRIPRREGGGYSGGTARARACYHREAVRCHTDNTPPGVGACHGCGGMLKLGRWMHRPAADPRPRFPVDVRIDVGRTSDDVAPTSPPGKDEHKESGGEEFDLELDVDENDAHGAGSTGGTGGGLSSFNATAASDANSGPGAGRRDLCPPCYAAHTHRHHRHLDREGRGPGSRARGGRGSHDNAQSSSHPQPDESPNSELVPVMSLADLGRERPRYDVALYGVFKRARAAAQDARVGPDQ